MVALVGENGSGKTTLIKLLCRLYDPVSGNIAIDGIDLRQFDPVAIRREVSVILQNYARYCLTARENIWLGDISLPAHDDKILHAARQTRADDFIQKLPRGYETVLGHEFEDQGELSQGEWQKVALARAFLRQAQLIILDEPTSWMDARAEYEVFQSFRKMFHRPHGSAHQPPLFHGQAGGLHLCPGRRQNYRGRHPRRTYAPGRQVCPTLRNAGKFLSIKKIAEGNNSSNCSLEDQEISTMKNQAAILSQLVTALRKDWESTWWQGSVMGPEPGTRRSMPVIGLSLLLWGC